VQLVVLGIARTEFLSFIAVPILPPFGFVP